MKKYISVLIAALFVSGAWAQTAGTAPKAEPPSATSAAKTDKGDKADNANKAAEKTPDMRIDQHINGLHAKLKITADQEKLWSNVADTMRDNAREMDKAIQKRKASATTATAVDELKAYGDMTQLHADSVKKLASAFEPLYKAMPDDQKKLADEVFAHRMRGQAMFRHHPMHKHLRHKHSR